MSLPPPQTRAGRWWPVLVVVAGVLAGLLIAVLGGGRWRLGSVVIGGALLLGAGIRAALPPREAGLLAVRSRPFDVAVLAIGGVAIIVLALAIPPD